MANTDTHSKETEEAKLEGSSSQLNMELEKQHGGANTPHNVDSVLEDYATIMATNKPDPWGPGSIRLYILAATIFLCSTMSGQ